MWIYILGYTEVLVQNSVSIIAAFWLYISFFLSTDYKGWIQSDLSGSIFFFDEVRMRPPKTPALPPNVPQVIF